MFRLRHFVYLFALVALAFSRAHGQDIYDCYNGSSEQGGNRITVNGIQSNQYTQQSYPGATVTVFVHNTSTLATIFKDAAGTLPLANPFTSSAHSVAFICAADGRYDLQYSGLGITVPFTVSDIKFCFSCQGGGGGGGVNPGTPKQVTRYNAAGTNIEDSSGSDDPTNGPTRWVNGLSVESNGLAKIGVNSPNGTVENLLVCADGSVPSVFEVTTCPAGSSKALGVADTGAGTTGNVRIYDHAYHACIFDNQTAIDDYVAPSATDAGQCSDVGGVKPSNVQILGKITSVNSGAGTLATVDWFTGDTIAPGSSGGSGTVSPCATANSNALFVAAGTVVNCDGFVTDDGAGFMTMKGLGLTDTSHSGFLFQKQGALPAIASLNSVYLSVGASLGTSYGIQWFASAPTATHCVDLVAGDAVGWLKLHDAGAACGTGGGVTQISTPSAPTATNLNAAGARSITYEIVGCEDGPVCADHTPPSSTTVQANANASPQVKLTAYGDTLYGPRCYDVFVTADSGSRTGVPGRIANCVGKAFIDTGGNATGSAPTDNTTELQPSFVSQVPCNIHPSAPKTLPDAPPCAPNVLDDEMGATFGAPGDANDGVWTWVNQNSCTSGWTDGMIKINCPDRATAGNPGQLNCLMQPVPASATYSLVIPFYFNTIPGGNVYPTVAFRDSAGGKMVSLGPFLDNAHSNGVLVGHWTNATTLSSFVVNQGIPQITNPAYLELQNDSTNLILLWSPDGIQYSIARTESIVSFLGTAPDQWGMCLNTASGDGYMDVDFARRTQ